MQAKIKRITDILRRDDGINGAMAYTEQISRILFLKFLDDYEQAQAATATLNGESYTHILDKTHQRDTRACPKTADGTLDTNNALSGDDLKEFVKLQLFPYLK